MVHFSKTEMEDVLRRVVAKAHVDAGDDTGRRLRSRVFEALGPAMLRVTLDERNNGTSMRDIIIAQSAVIAWFLAVAVRSANPGDARSDDELIALRSILQFIERDTIRRLGGEPFARIEPEPGGHA